MNKVELVGNEVYEELRNVDWENILDCRNHSLDYPRKIETELVDQIVIGVVVVDSLDSIHLLLVCAHVALAEEVVLDLVVDLAFPVDTAGVSDAVVVACYLGANAV